MAFSSSDLEGKEKKNGDYTPEEFEQYGKELRLILTHIFNTIELKGIYSDICDMIYAWGLEARWLELRMYKMELKDCSVAFGIQIRAG